MTQKMALASIAALTLSFVMRLGVGGDLFIGDALMVGFLGIVRWAATQ